MPTLKASAERFLNQQRIAVIGMRTANPTDIATLIYSRLRAAGYTVFGVNPTTATIADDPCYDALCMIPGGVDAAVIVVPPDQTAHVVHECARLGIQHVWMHKSLSSSVSREAVDIAEERGLDFIPGGCPLMFIEPVSRSHKALYSLLSAVGRIPRVVHTVPLTEPAAKPF
jgi:uncharacterized protein